MRRATMPAVATREDHFSFGLWTVGWQARDPFGDPTRGPLDPIDAVRHLGELGAWGVTFHDDDLVPFGSDAATRDRIIAAFRTALSDAGMVIEMVTVSYTHLRAHETRHDLVCRLLL